MIAAAPAAQVKRARGAGRWTGSLMPNRRRSSTPGAYASRRRVDSIVQRMQNSGLQVEVPNPLPSAAFHPKWMRWTPALSRYAEYARQGVVVAENVLEGWVVRSDQYGVEVEIETPDGTVLRQNFLRKQLNGEVIPEEGGAVRIIAHLVTAPDLEDEPSMADLDALIDHQELTPVEMPVQAGGEYRLPE